MIEIPDDLNDYPPYMKRGRVVTPLDSYPDHIKNHYRRLRILKRHPEWKELSYEEMIVKQKEHKIEASINNLKRSYEKYNAMSDEEKRKFNARKNNFSKLSREDQEKKIKSLKEGNKKWWNNKTPEEKKEFANKRWENNPHKEKIIKNLYDGGCKYRENLSEEELYKKISHLNELRKFKLDNDLEFKEKSLDQLQSAREYYHDNMSDEQREYLREKSKQWWDNLSEEEMNRFREITIERNRKWWASRSNEELEEISKRLSDQNNAFWSTMSEEDRKKYVIPMRNGLKAWMNNLTREEKDQRSLQMSNRSKAWWNMLNHAEKEIFVKKILTSSIGKNKLHLQFESQFSEVDYDLIPEYPTTNHGVTHCWDYAIFYDDKLECLVDLDGAYFHADICDYDGIHSKLEYDEKRGRSIPDGVKWCIIYENHFDKSFMYMQRITGLTYDEFIDEHFNEYRSMPFPYPEYTNSELLKSFDQLQRMNCNDKYHRSLNVNTRIGDRIIQHFHHSLYNNIIDAWNDDEILRSMITQGYLYHSYINKNKILQGFNIYDQAQRVSILSAGKAKMIINKYLNKCDEVFDPCYNYGGIMLACIAMDKYYVGLCSNDIQRRECNNMLSFLRGNGIQYKVSFNDNVEHVCLFTEVNDDTQIDQCLSKYRCKRYIFITKRTERYRNNIVEEISINLNSYLVLKM